MKTVHGEGPPQSHIVGIGEAPGGAEIEVGRPFIGPSGNLLNTHLLQAGIDRRFIRMENLCERRPGKYSNAIEQVPVPELVQWAYDLHKRIAALDSPRVLVPMGNYATFVLTGKGKVKAAFRKALGGSDLKMTEAEKKAGITKLRGSVYEYEDMRGRRMKVVPTIHPSFFLHGQMKKQKRAIVDWKRIKYEAGFPELRRRKRTHVIDPLEFEVARFTEDVRDGAYGELSLDIETWGNTLTCVGFATSPAWSITIPTTTKAQKATFLPYIKAICESACPKIMQNGLYDTYWLAWAGIWVNNWLFDTLAMHHAIDPADTHSLDYLSSLYIPDHRYWKDEAKEAEEIMKYVKDLDALWVYNGKDCCMTWELREILHTKLEALGMVGFYMRHYQEMFEPMLVAMLHGTRVNAKEQKAWAGRLLKECDAIRLKLGEIAGEDLYATKAFSGKKLQAFFYKKLGVPKQFKMSKTTEGKKRTVTLDKTTLRKIALKYPKAQESARMLLDHRRKAKIATFMNKAWDKDKRVRCSYKFTPESGRFASSKNPKRSGMNLQNVDREIRETFLPDEGCAFLKFDLSQIEDRIVKMWTGSARLIEMANLRPDVFDCHTHNAGLIFGISEKDVVYEQRYLAKRAVHAAERGMHGKTLAEKLLDDGHVYTPKQCQKMIDQFLDEVWEIRDIYFSRIRELLRRDKMLVNNWGRVWRCEYDRFDDDLYRRGYSFPPQADDADMLNQWGFKATHNFLQQERMAAKINLQVHDEIIVSSPRSEAWEIAQFVVGSLERPRFYFGQPLIVPVGITVARSWKDSEFEFKGMPTEGVFMEAVDCVLEGVKG